MFTKKHFINAFSILFLFVINIIYLYDNSFSSSLYPIIYSLILVLLFSLLIYYVDKRVSTLEEINRKNFSFFFLSILIMFIAFESAFSPNKGLSYFTSFGWLTNLVNGVYPYNNNYAHSLPFLYYLHAPFFLLGNAGLISIFGLALCFFLILELSITKKELVVRMIILLLLPVVYYEVITGGDSLVNAVIAISLMFLINKYINSEKIDIRFFFLSIVFGTLLCTRFITVIPFTLSLLFFFRYNLKSLLMFLILSIIICFALIIPFIRWDYSMFNLFGPFNGNLAGLPLWFYILLFIVLLYAGWMISDLQELFFASGIFYIFYFINYIFKRRKLF